MALPHPRFLLPISCNSLYILRRFCETNPSNVEPRSQESCWRTPEGLATSLYKRIVAKNEHFVVIDKPANLSVFGQPLSKQCIMGLMGYKALSDPTNLCVRDCLPHLQVLLDESECGVSERIPVTTLYHMPHGFKKPTGTQSPEKLHIIEALPSLYSGLILLGRTLEYTKAAIQFYAKAMTYNPPWQMYQQFLAVCWGHPSRDCTTNELFPICSYHANDILRVGYRPPPDEISLKKKTTGTVLQKRVSHKTVRRFSNQVSLVELWSNSTVRGLPEVYLLYEGCSVVGEMLQASRLISTHPSVVVAHPSQIQLNGQLPGWLRDRASRTGLRDVPVHLHRTRLYLPCPVFTRANASRVSFEPVLHSFAGRIESESTQFPTLGWTSLTDYATRTKSDKHLVLSCCSPGLPDHFCGTLQRLNAEFDYSSWICNTNRCTE